MRRADHYPRESEKQLYGSGDEEEGGDGGGECARWVCVLEGVECVNRVNACCGCDFVVNVVLHVVGCSDSSESEYEMGTRRRRGFEAS
jgi:hypothetical protein